MDALHKRPVFAQRLKHQAATQRIEKPSIITNWLSAFVSQYLLIFGAK
jgi:hypothetical protein